MREVSGGCAPFRFKVNPFRFEANPFRFEANPFRFEVNPFRFEVNPFRFELKLKHPYNLLEGKHPLIPLKGELAV